MDENKPSYKVNYDDFMDKLRTIIENNIESEIRVRVYDRGEWITVKWTYKNPLLRNHQVTFHINAIEYNLYDEILQQIAEKVANVKW